MKVAFQGETGAYSEEAVFALCPGATPIACPSFERVFESVVSGDVAHGVVPIENSLHGSVHQNYDHLREYPVAAVVTVAGRASACGRENWARRWLANVRFTPNLRAWLKSCSKASLVNRWHSSQ